ncbi:hypothetical protein N2152v2_006836 [Parachlorella kessleri]
MKEAIGRPPRQLRVCAKLANSDLLIVAQKAAKAGAEVVLERVEKPRTINYKGAIDLVTDTDLASEESILKVVEEAFPGHAILGEEGGVKGDTASEYLWCIDPIDGTTNFAHGYPSFSISVAVLHRTLPVAACVVEFSGGPGIWVTRTYAASRNGGATCNGKPISVSRTHELQRSLLVTGFGYEHDECWDTNMNLLQPGIEQEPALDPVQVTGFGYEHDECWNTNMELFKEFTRTTQGVRRLGSAAVDMCHVASGMAEAYWEYRLKPWDMAAGVLVVEEAGGTVTTLDGRPFSVFERSVLVSNGFVHEAILSRTEPRTAELVKEGIDLSQASAARSLQRVGLQHHLLGRLLERNITTAKDLFARTPLDLVELLDLPYETVQQIRLDVAVRITPAPHTALDLWKQAAERPVHLPSTLTPLDEALHGGIPSGSITELVGPAGLGKTQFCLMLSLVGCLASGADGGTVLYVDTERKFSSKRLSEIGRARFPAELPSQQAVEALLPRVTVVTPDSSAGLMQCLQSLETLVIDHAARLIIVDSIAALARSDYGAGAGPGSTLADRQALLSQQAARLKQLAETFRIPVLVTNQVTTMMRGGEGASAGVGGEGQLTAALGTLWAHAVNTRLVLESFEGTRFLRIAKSPAAPAAAFAYAVTSAGLEILPGIEAPARLLAEGNVVDMAIANEVPYEQAEAFMVE